MVYIIPKRNRKMCRVTDNYVCVGNRLHHPASRPALLQTSDLSLNLRISFHLLELFLDFFFGHFKILLIFPSLEEEIKPGNSGKDHSNLQYHAYNLVQHIGGGRNRIHIRHLCDYHKLILQNPVQYNRQNNNLEDCLYQLHKLSRRKQIFNPFQWIKLAQVKLQRFSCEKESGLYSCGKHADRQTNHANRKNTPRRSLYCLHTYELQIAEGKLVDIRNRGQLENHALPEPAVNGREK